MAISSDEMDYFVNDLYGFYSYWIIEKDYVPAKHIKELAEELSNLGDGDRIVINMPPRMSKSSLITLSYPIYEYLHNKDLNIVIVTSTMTLAEKFGIIIKEWFNVHGNKFNCFKSDIKHSKTHLMFEDRNGALYNGSIRLTSAGSTLTGLDIDILILDDIYKGLTDITPSLLDKKIEWFKTIILQRLEPHTKLLILHTRWSQNDLTGYLKEHNEKDYKFIELPAIKEDGSVLWENRYDAEFFSKRESEMGERLFSALYQQKPLDETGTFFNLDLVKFESNTRAKYDYFSTVRSYDLAYSDEEKGDINDYTASCVMSRTLDNHLIIHEVSMEQYGDNLANVLKRNAYLDSPNIPILLETGTTGGASEFLFKEYQKTYLRGYNVKQSLPIGAKVDRATPLRDAILDGKIVADLDENGRELLIRQLRSFPLGKHEDLVDAVSYAYNYLSLSANSNDIISTGLKKERFRI